jgi:hypothetical protein
VRITCVKFSVFALVAFVAVALIPVASATSLDLTLSGQTVGTITLTQSGSNVNVSNTTSWGYALATQGHGKRLDSQQR